MLHLRSSQLSNNKPSKQCIKDTQSYPFLLYEKLITQYVFTMPFIKHYIAKHVI